MSVKFIIDKEDIIAFFPESSRFFKVNEQTKDVIQKIDQGATLADLSDDGLNEEVYNKIKDTVVMCNTPIPPQGDGERRVGRLALHLTNKCNLRCAYCYANGGVYKSEEGVMDESVAKQTLDYFYNNTKSIGLVQLFGGEPTMNLPLIEYVCDYVTKKNEQLKYKTQLGIVTNGTLVTDELIEIIKKYDIEVTVSYDGDPQVNDKLRVNKNGTGTSHTILENIKRMRELTGQPSLIEITYTRHHVEAGLSIMDITKSIHETLGDIALHIVPAGGSDKCDFALKDKKMFGESVDEIFQEAKDIPELQKLMYSLVERTVSAITTKGYTKYICDAGTRNFSVSVKGDVYPCFIVTDEKDLCMGNVFDKDLFSSEQFQNVVSKFEEFNKETNEECKNCFIRKSCYACLGLNYIDTGNMFCLKEDMCDMMRSMAERTIVGLYRMTSEKI